MIHVVAIITAKPGQREAILQAFRENLAAVRAEPGCIQYGPAIDIDNAGPFQAPLGPDSFMVIEKWESVEALQTHIKTPHMAAYGARTADLTASRAIHVLRDAE